MTLASTLQLDSLCLKNYRCFADCTVDFHSELTVLVAENGFGKTALLDAAALALGTFVNAVDGSKRGGFRRGDVRVVPNAERGMSPVLPTSLSARGKIDGQRVSWQRSVNSTGPNARTTWADAKRAEAAARGLRTRLESFAGGSREDAPPLPLVASYGTGRLWDQDRLTERRRYSSAEPMGRMSGYIDCLSPSSSFKAFGVWYENMVRAIQETPVTGVRRPDRPENLLAAVQAAARVVLEPTGWRAIDWDPDQALLVAEHPEHGRLPLSFLSDGVRNMIALVADVAHRCARLNPHFGTEAAKLTSGVLLIDEVDMHLHPRWQQQVLGLLRDAFPAMQMVVTTHSPQVLSTVDVESIRIVRHADGVGTLEQPRFQTRGVESADVMAAIMGVDPVPQVPEARWLSDYRALIEDGKADSNEATQIRGKVLDHFGDSHPLMLDCERLIRFQKFRLKRSSDDGERS